MPTASWACFGAGEELARRCAATGLAGGVPALSGRCTDLATALLVGATASERMVSAYLVSNEGDELEPVAADFAGAGIAVLGRSDARGMVQAVIDAKPDILVCFDPHPGDALFAGTEALDCSAPRPTVVFTTDPDADKIQRATQSGVHAYIVNGYGSTRLRSIIHVAQARFRHIEKLRGELADVQHRFSERKLVDQAKAILMRLRNIPEDEAYGALRTAAMKANRRMGQVARHVIEAARYGDGVNRAGHLRMTSQRVVKLYALLCVGCEGVAEQFAGTLARIDANLAALTRSLSKPTYGDLLEQVGRPSAELRTAVKDPPTLGRLPKLDRLAERVLTEAEHLTASLESAGFPSALRLINVAGRQRMLSQRYAKQALLAALLDGDAAAEARAGLARSAAEFATAEVYLKAVPLASPEISGAAARAAAGWAALQAIAPRAGTVEGRRGLLEASEALLEASEELTGHYERSLLVLLQS